VASSRLGDSRALRGEEADGGQCHEIRIDRLAEDVELREVVAGAVSIPLFRRGQWKEIRV
jgi:hypothetical protein